MRPEGLCSASQQSEPTMTSHSRRGRSWRWCRQQRPYAYCMARSPNGPRHSRSRSKLRDSRRYQRRSWRRWRQARRERTGQACSRSAAPDVWPRQPLSRSPTPRRSAIRRRRSACAPVRMQRRRLVRHRRDDPADAMRSFQRRRRPRTKQSRQRAEAAGSLPQLTRSARALLGLCAHVQRSDASRRLQH